MSNAIQSSTSSAGNAPGSAAISSSDWLTRMGADAQGGNAQNFARWMAQHAPQSQAPMSQATLGAQASHTAPASPAHASQPQAGQPTSAAAKGPGWNATQQKLAAARSQSGTARPQQVAAQPNASAAATRQGAATQAQARADAAKSDASKASPVQGKRSGDAPDSTEADGSHEAEAKASDKPDTHASSMPADGGALVRELTPPPTVQAHDPAGMMAWLASLTQSGGDAQAAGGEALSEQAGREGEGVGRTLALGREDEGRGAGRALGAGARLAALAQDGAGKGGAAAHGDAALQVDALLGKGRESLALQGEGVKGAGQDAAALMAADAARVASFGQTLSEVREAQSHAQATLPTPLDAPDFSQKLADQVSLWVGQARNDGPMTAELHLNPAEMGPINVKISLDGQSAHVDFAAAALETRQAIEASLSMLSSSLNDVGLSLSGGGVFSQTPQQQQAFSQAAPGSSSPTGRGGRNDGDEAEPLGMRQVSAPRSSRLGGLDLYA